VFFNIKNPSLRLSIGKRIGAGAIHTKLKARGEHNVQVGGNVERLTVNNGNPQPIPPEVRAQLYGNGSACQFTGPGFTSKSGRRLYLISVNIAGVESSIGMNFMRRLPVESFASKLSWPPEIFTAPTPSGSVPFSFTYRTTDGRTYRQSQNAMQQARVGDSHFNLTLDDPIDLVRL